MKFGPITRGLVIFGLCLCVLLLVTSARALIEARAEQARAEQAFARADLDLAITYLRRAARWNAPFNVYAQDAFERLEKLAADLERQGDRARALTAYRAVHASIHASRGLWASEEARLQRADRHIARLMASEPPAGVDASLTAEQRQELYLSQLAGRRPSAFWVVFALSGFATWVTAAAVFLLRGVDRQGRVVRRIARRSGLVLLLGWLAFALGLRLA
jgi:hypothetical protein